MGLTDDEKFNLLHSDAAWRMGVDAQLQGIMSSLKDLVRIEEKQTSLMESIGELKRKSAIHDEMSQDLALMKHSMDTMKETVDKLVAGLETHRKETDERLDVLESRADRESWATKSIERLVAFLAVTGALLSHLIDFGD